MIVIKTNVNVDVLKNDIEVFFSLEHFRWTNHLNQAYDFQSEMAAESFIINFLSEAYPELTISYESVEHVRFD